MEHVSQSAAADLRHKNHPFTDGLKTARRALYTEPAFSGKLAAHLEETERCAGEIVWDELNA